MSYGWPEHLVFTQKCGGAPTCVGLHWQHIVLIYHGDGRPVYIQVLPSCYALYILTLWPQYGALRGLGGVKMEQINNNNNTT